MMNEAHDAPAGFDPSVWRELPLDIRRELSLGPPPPPPPPPPAAPPAAPPAGGFSSSSRSQQKQKVEQQEEEEQSPGHKKMPRKDQEHGQGKIWEVGGEELQAPPVHVLGKRAPAPFPLFNINKTSDKKRGKDSSGTRDTRDSRDSSGVAVVVVQGSDSILPAADVARWRNLMQQYNANTTFEDSEFPANSFSICGKEDVVDKEETAGVDGSAPSRPVYVLGQTPKCFCNAPAAKRAVKLNTANKGREYFCCSSRHCKYFQWRDGDAQIPSQSRKRRACTWTRFGSSLPVVTDYGYRAADLMQGGVGDCWFMSALAVVAHRHDLICKLLEVPQSCTVDVSSSLSTTMQQISNAAGVYTVRLFLDGSWNTVFVDDQLPVSGSPRRFDIALNFSSLAFCRCGSTETGGQQLWASLIEKAYAKAHGSYQAISGGEISEALLDLTGAPSLTIDFSSVSFQSEDLWAALLRWRQAELPMGCSTDADPNLEVVGLHGMHAYSILDVREVLKPAPRFPPREAFSSDEEWYIALSSTNLGGNYTTAGDGTSEVVRLIQIRNPHGVGEWTGAYSDQSEELNELLSSSSDNSHSHTNGRAPHEGSAIRRTAINDGTFWIDYTHFLLGFSRLDVSFAYRDWHSRSFNNYFPKAEDKVRLCAMSYWVRQVPLGVKKSGGSSITHVTMSALQRTRRGAWCRSDVKKSYKYGHLSLLLLRRTITTNKELEWTVVAGGLSGASRENTIGVTLEANNTSGGCEYLLVVYCLGSTPSAAETTSKQPFTLRFTSSQPIEVVEVPSSSLRTSPPDTVKPQVEDARSIAFLAAFFLHMSFSNFFGRCSSQFQNVEASSFNKDMIALGENVFRKIEPLTRNILVLTLQSRSSLVVMLYNTSPVNGNSMTEEVQWNDGASVEVSVLVYAKSAIARGKDGLIKDNKELSNVHNAQLSEKYTTEKSRLKPLQSGFRYPTKWSAYQTISRVAPGEGRLLLLLTSGGVQYQAKDIQFTLKSPYCSSSSASAEKKTVRSMESWAVGQRFQDSTTDGNPSKKRRVKLPPTSSIFDPQLISASLREFLHTEVATMHRRATVQGGTIHCQSSETDVDIQAAIEMSLAANVCGAEDYHTVDDPAFQEALRASIMESDNARGGDREIIRLDNSPPNRHIESSSKLHDSHHMVDLTVLSQEKELVNKVSNSIRGEIIDLISDD